jgi:hypothetical protein
VADLQLIAAALVWTLVVHVTDIGLTTSAMVGIVSLSGGALLANSISAILLIIEISLLRH